MLRPRCSRYSVVSRWYWPLSASTVLSYAVTERTREIGIRLTQRAQSRDLLRLVIAQGMAPTIIGLMFGIAAAFAFTRVMLHLATD